MRKPIIGITANERLNPEDNFAMTSYAATGFVEAVTKVGGIPVILPISDEKMARHYVSIVDKMIITGGQNVDPKFYGEEKTIDRKWIPDVLENLGEESIHKAVKILRVELDPRKLVQDIFNIEKKANPAAL